MKIYRLLLFVLLLSACKTTAPIVPLVLKDSVSITYKQGKEQPASPDAIGAQTDFRKNSSSPALGKVGLGATREASVFEEVQSVRTKKQAVPPTTTIRVDTVFVERWHTTEVPSPPKPIPRFYKDCTWGFFILILLTLGGIAFRILKAIYLRR